MPGDFLIRLIYTIMTNSQIVTTRILIMQATNKIKNIRTLEPPEKVTRRMVIMQATNK